MKMVIVFDTEDTQGMRNTLKIVDALARDYLGRGMDDRLRFCQSEIRAAFHVEAWRRCFQVSLGPSNRLRPCTAR